MTDAEVVKATLAAVGTPRFEALREELRKRLARDRTRLLALRAKWTDTK